MTREKKTSIVETKYGFHPDKRCDECGGEFYQSPIVDQDRCGWYKVFCSKSCLQVFYQKRGKSVDDYKEEKNVSSI